MAEVPEVAEDQEALSTLLYHLINVNVFNGRCSAACGALGNSHDGKRTVSSTS